MINLPLGKPLLIAAFLAAFSSCYRVPDTIEPKVNYHMQDKYLLQLPSPFPPLTPEEELEDWSKEYRIGMGFAHELDLYQAITAFKRAFYLLRADHKTRKTECSYEILLCYYIGRKYQEAIYTFEHTDLRLADTTFPACHDMLVILFDCYTQVKDLDNAAKFLEYIQTYYPETAQKLQLSFFLQEGNLPGIEHYAQEEKYPYLTPFLSTYQSKKKSVAKAQTLSALFPGAGYFYLGQKQSAITATLLNGLFIGASCFFFLDGNIPAGIIFAGFEAGWYFGGIYGSGEEAKFYNERMYEKTATPMMNQAGLFPAFMIRHAF